MLAIDHHCQRARRGKDLFKELDSSFDHGIDSEVLRNGTPSNLKGQSVDVPQVMGCNVLTLPLSFNAKDQNDINNNMEIDQPEIIRVGISKS